MGQFDQKFIFENPPLVTVLAKVQFSPILKIADYVPDLQDFVRKKGFPSFREKQVKQMQFGSNVPPRQVDQRFWQFTNAETTQIVSLTPDFFTLTVSDYTSFDSFSSPLRLALDSIAEIVAPESRVFLGFRSVNVIEGPDESPENFWPLLAPGLHGIDHRNLNTTHLHHQYRYWSETPSGNLTVTGRSVHAWEAIPQDLRSENLSMKRKFSGEKIVYALELDHNTSRRPQIDRFDVQQILADVDRLHETTNLGFLSCITEEARRLWGFREIQ